MTTTCGEEVEVQRTTAGEDDGCGMAPITGRGEVLLARAMLKRCRIYFFSVRSLRADVFVFF